VQSKASNGGGQKLKGGRAIAVTLKNEGMKINAACVGQQRDEALCSLVVLSSKACSEVEH
jgi:hypothetical protein